MNPDRWRQVDLLLEEAIETTSGGPICLPRSGLCSRSRLRRDVDALLQAHQKSDGFLHETAIQMRARQIAVDRPLL